MLLAIDTATRTISLALHDGQRVHAERSWQTANHHTVELSPAIMRMLDQAGATIGDLTGLAVAKGPGSFMGLRIGLGVAKGIALTRRLPLVAVPTLDITASAQPRTRGRLVAVLQAGRGRICTQVYTWSRRQSPAGWRARGELWLGRWPALVERVDREMTFCGEIDPAGHAALATLGDLARVRPAASSLRRAGWLAEVAWRRLRAGETDDPFTVAPVYIS